jgi:hypothetical protein
MAERWLLIASLFEAVHADRKDWYSPSVVEDGRPPSFCNNTWLSRR